MFHAGPRACPRTDRWPEKVHAESARAVAEKVQGNGGGQRWQLQTPVLQWFQQQCGLNTQAT